MRALVEQGMKDGAFGLSTGLFYVPGTFTPTAEVIELAKVAARYGGMHESHMRFMHAAVARRDLRQLDNFCGWREGAGHVEETGAQAERAVFHSLLDQRAHPVQLDRKSVVEGNTLAVR